MQKLNETSTKLSYGEYSYKEFLELMFELDEDVKKLDEIDEYFYNEAHENIWDSQKFDAEIVSFIDEELDEDGEEQVICEIVKFKPLYQKGVWYLEINAEEHTGELPKIFEFYSKKDRKTYLKAYKRKWGFNRSLNEVDVIKQQGK